MCVRVCPSQETGLVVMTDMVSLNHRQSGGVYTDEAVPAFQPHTATQMAAMHTHTVPRYAHTHTHTRVHSDDPHTEACVDVRFLMSCGFQSRETQANLLPGDMGVALPQRQVLNTPSSRACVCERVLVWM